MQCTCSRRRVCNTQSMLSECKSGVQCACSVCAVCVQCVCSTHVMSLHVWDTVCAVRMHLEAVRGALSTKHMCSVCTSSEHQDECSGCAAMCRVCAVSVHPVCSVHSGNVHLVCSACAVKPTTAAQRVQGVRTPVCSVCRMTMSLVFSAHAMSVHQTCSHFPRRTDREQDTCTVLTDTKVCILCVPLSLLNPSLQQIYPSQSQTLHLKTSHLSAFCAEEMDCKGYRTCGH